MAKGLRASVNKRNKSKLRDRVFGPVEAARTERLSAKLLELAQQPKPSRDTEMKVDGQEVEIAEKEGANVAEDATESQSLSLPFTLSFPIPASLSSCNSDEGDHSSESGSDTEAKSVIEGYWSESEDNFYTMLGLCNDIAGFSSCGHLELVFEQ